MAGKRIGHFTAQGFSFLVLVEYRIGARHGPWLLVELIVGRHRIRIVVVLNMPVPEYVGATDRAICPVTVTEVLIPENIGAAYCPVPLPECHRYKAE